MSFNLCLKIYCGGFFRFLRGDHIDDVELSITPENWDAWHYQVNRIIKDWVMAHLIIPELVSQLQDNESSQILMCP